MASQQQDADMVDAVNYRDQAKAEHAAEIDLTATQMPLTSQLQIFQSVHEPAVQSLYTPKSSLTLAGQNKLTNVNLGGLSMCKVDHLRVGNWISWKTRIHRFFNLFKISDIVHGIEPILEDPILA